MCESASFSVHICPASPTFHEGETKHHRKKNALMFEIVLRGKVTQLSQTHLLFSPC